MIDHITQSFIKDYREYLAGKLCGNIITERWVNDRLLDNEEPGQMELGAYFEFMAFGTLPKNGKVPVPQYMPSAIKKNGGSTVGLKYDDMLVAYRQATRSAKLLVAQIEKMGLRVAYKGKKYEKDGFEGTVDLVCQVMSVKEGFTWSLNEFIVIDLKYSGLVGKSGDRYNKHGWQWSPVQKEYHGTQAKQYHFITELRFYFLVTQSNQKEGDDPVMKLFDVPVTEEMVAVHIAEGMDLLSNFKFAAKTIGFEPHPSFNVCQGCALYNECKDRYEFPRPERVDLQLEEYLKS